MSQATSWEKRLQQVQKYEDMSHDERLAQVEQKLESEGPPALFELIEQQEAYALEVMEAQLQQDINGPTTPSQLAEDYRLPVARLRRIKKLVYVLERDLSHLEKLLTEHFQQASASPDQEPERADGLIGRAREYLAGIEEALRSAQQADVLDQPSHRLHFRLARKLKDLPNVLQYQRHAVNMALPEHTRRPLVGEAIMDWNRHESEVHRQRLQDRSEARSPASRSR